MQAPIVLPESLKPGVKPDTENRLEKKPEGPGFLTLVMHEIAKQPAAAEFVPQSIPETRPMAQAPDTAAAAETAAQAARNERTEKQSESKDRDVRDSDERRLDERSDKSFAKEVKDAEDKRALASEGQAPVSEKRDSRPRLERRDDMGLRAFQTRLHAAFDLRPLDAGIAARLERAMTKTQGHLEPAAAGEKAASLEKAFVDSVRASVENGRSARAQTKKPEAASVVIQTPAELRENVKSRDIKDKNVTISVNPEKWTIEHEKRDLRDSRSQAQGERRETVRELAGSKMPRLQTQNNEVRENAFSELLRTAPAAMESRALPETRESFSKLVERARINVAADGSSTASMRLKPEQLGNVTLNLRVVGSQVEAKLVVESELVKKMMKEEIEQLAVELKRQGFSVDAIEIRVREPSEESALPFAQNPESENRDPRAGTGALWAAPASVHGENFEYGAEAAEQWEGSVNLAV